MKKIFVGAIILVSSSVFANPYKSGFVDVSIQTQEGCSGTVILATH
ncbi:hypothetical protein I6E85_17695 [Pseudoalteromonas sp. NZS71]|nr:hypothetical protein [Pseudoalteromonas sp. NZS71]MBH0062968.1 hypothetical protein [Pseudoalteromonas sp. NZS71]